MKQELLSTFAKDVNISVRTLKAKYGDCIHREGRQSFIDSEKFEIAFPERSRQGRVSKRDVTRSPHLGQVDFQLALVRGQIVKQERVVEMAKKRFEASEESATKERNLLAYLDEKERIQKMESRKEKLTARRNYLVEKKKEKLFSFDEEGLLATL